MLILIEGFVVAAKHVGQSRTRRRSNRIVCIAEQFLHLVRMCDQAFALNKIQDGAIDQDCADQQEANGNNKGDTSCEAAQHRDSEEPLA